MPSDAFPPTLSTWIDARLADGELGRAEVNRHIMLVYAEPLRIYALGTRSGHLGDAVDLVQGFFADRLGRPGYFRGWRESGLRLRRWLMNGFGFYLKELRRERRKQGSEQPLEEEGAPPEVDGEVPRLAEEMDRAFAISVVREALQAGEASCRAKGQTQHWEIFRRHYYDGLEYASFVGEYGLAPARAAELARTAAGKFKSALRDLLARDGALESEIDAELDSLLEACG